MSEKVSLIIPVYNAEKYLKECLDSVLEQSYKPIEIILVNDGSTDRSAEIIADYEKKEKKIKVIHQSNQGVCSARNLGMAAATGEYIVFADSDDILPYDSIEKRKENIREADLVICRYECFDENGLKDSIQESSCTCWDQNTAIKSVLLDDGFGYQGYLWNKLYRRDIIADNHIEFEEGISYNEDKLFNLVYILASKKIRVSNEVVYQYRKDSGGAMNRLKNATDKDYAHIVSEFKAFDIMLDRIAKIDVRLYHQLALYSQKRAVRIQSGLKGGTASALQKTMGENIYKYGWKVFGADIIDISFLEQIKCFVHAIIKR